MPHKLFSHATAYKLGYNSVKSYLNAFNGNESHPCCSECWEFKIPANETCPHGFPSIHLALAMVPRKDSETEYNIR